MAKVIAAFDASPGLRFTIEREQDYFFATIGKWAVELQDGKLSVGEYWQAGFKERPMFRADAE